MKTTHRELLEWMDAVAREYGTHPRLVMPIWAFGPEDVEPPYCVILGYRNGPDGERYVILGPAPRGAEVKK